jgi:hypothetical protein
VADDVARDSPRRPMYQVIQVTVHTTKRRWRVQNRRRLRIRQRPGVGLFAGPTSSSLTQASSARPRLYSYTGVSNLHVGDCAQRLCVQLRHVRVSAGRRDFGGGGEKIIERLAAAYRPALSVEQVSLFSPSSGGASFSRLPLITYGRRSGSKQVGAGGLVLQ